MLFELLGLFLLSPNIYLDKTCNLYLECFSDSYSYSKYLFGIYMQTPDGALLDMLRNAHDILSPCDIKLPEVKICISLYFIYKLIHIHLVGYSSILQSDIQI
jgi:hypothetical protein